VFLVQGIRLRIEVRYIVDYSTVYHYVSIRLIADEWEAMFMGGTNASRYTFEGFRICEKY
jgi:hypothetical protein